mgnify:CR=1 FL=1
MGSKYFLTILAIFCLLQSPLQAQFLKKLKNKVEKAAEETVLNKADKKTRKETGKVLDTTIDGEEKEEGSKGGSSTGPVAGDSGEVGQQGTGTSDLPKGVAAYSKFDFEAGETVISYEDFSNDAIGDLPARWNSSSSAEVVTLGNVPGKWVKFSQGNGSFVPEFIKEFPENFTLEYDLVFDYDQQVYAYTRNFYVNVSDVENPGYQMGDYSPGRNGAYFVVKGGIGQNGDLGFVKYASDSKLNISSDKEVPELIKGMGRGKVLHISMWRQGTRLRIYFNEGKAFDIPRAFEPGVVLNGLRFFSQLSEPDSYYYLGNIRYAVGKADMRSKLVSEGKLVTYGITFDKGKADVKSESYGVLKSISEVLKENAAMKVKIVGHTDADGDADSNLALSKARADAVSKFLVGNFSVSPSQLVTDGKGESQLLREGNSPDAHALNRRVEFLKQ